MYSKDELVQIFEKIDWSIRHCGCGYYRLYNHKGEVQPFIFRPNFSHLEVTDDNKYVSFSFVICMKHVTISELESGCICILINDSKNEQTFINFYNHDKE